MICGSGGSKSRLAKAAGAEPAGQMRDKKLHAVVARSTFQSRNVQNTPGADHFWQLRCRKSARRCGAKHISKSKCTKHTISDHFWKLRCRKSARRCGPKHISKSKCTKHTMLGPLLEVEMSKKCTPLWREAHFEVKMYKSHHARTTFGSWDVEKLHAVVARSTFRSQNVQNTPGSDHFWKLRCRKSALPLWREAHFEVKMLKALGVRTTFGGSDAASRGRRKGLCTLSKVSKRWGYCSIFNYNHHYTTLHSNTLHSITVNYTQLHYTTLHYTTLHYTTLHYSTLPSTTLHYTKLHYITLHYITLHSTTLNYITLHDTTFHYTTLHYTTLHYTTLHSTTLHYITLHDTTFHYTSLHYTTLHYTPQHYNYNYTTTLHYTPLH